MILYTFLNLKPFLKIINNCMTSLAEEAIESDVEEDSAIAFKKAGSEASEPDVAKFKVLTYTIIY